MKAAISGLRELALVVDAGQVIRVDLGGRRQPANLENTHRLVYELGDAQFIDCADLDEVHGRLCQAVEEVDALQLALILLDATLSIDTRRDAATELEESFKHGRTLQYVERILHARALGVEHDLVGAKKLLGTPGSVREFLVRLAEAQPSIHRVEAAWARIEEGMFQSISRRDAYARLTRLGVVHAFVHEWEASRRPDTQAASDLSTIIEAWRRALATAARVSSYQGIAQRGATMSVLSARDSAGTNKRKARFQNPAQVNHAQVGLQNLENAHG